MTPHDASSSDSRSRWDARHVSAGPPIPALPEAAEVLGIELGAPGRALDVAAGRGSVSLWLAAAGWTVDAVDISPVGLDLARQADTRGAVRWIVHDLETGLPDGLADRYDLIVVQRYRQVDLDAPLVERLGGLLLVTNLSEVGSVAGTFRAAPGGLLERFGHLEVLAHVEGDGVAHLAGRRVPDPAPSPAGPGRNR